MDYWKFGEQLWCTLGYQEGINFCQNRIDEGGDTEYYELVMQELDYIYDQHFNTWADTHYSEGGPSEEAQD